MRQVGIFFAGRLLGYLLYGLAVSGDFSLSAEGFRIKGGRIDTPVEQITVAGNFYQLLAEVEELADDLYFGSGGVGSPSVLVRGLAIAGS